MIFFKKLYRISNIVINIMIYCDYNKLFRKLSLNLQQNHSIMLDKWLGETIRKRRKSLKITQPYLADLANISVNTLYKIERGEANPTIDILKKIADVLGLEIKLEIKQTGK